MRRARRFAAIAKLGGSFVRRMLRSCLVSLLVLLPLIGPAPAAQASTSDHDKSMIDTDTPQYIGYDKALKAYHFRVTGRWRASCGGLFCWGPVVQGPRDIGSNDAVLIRFSDAVQFKKFEIRTYDACGHRKYVKAKAFSSDSFEDAYAGVNDQVYAGWTKIWSNGKLISSQGTCKLSTMPTYSVSAGTSGGTGSVMTWADLRTHSYTYDVWINPAPSQGRCYDRLYVKGGYTHTWSSQGLSWSVGYPWGVGVGVVSGSHHFTVFQGSDGFPDKDLKSPKLCRH